MFENDVLITSPECHSGALIRNIFRRTLGRASKMLQVQRTVVFLVSWGIKIEQQRRNNLHIAEFVEDTRDFCGRVSSTYLKTDHDLNLKEANKLEFTYDQLFYMQPRQIKLPMNQTELSEKMQQTGSFVLQLWFMTEPSELPPIFPKRTALLVMIKYLVSYRSL